jgi:hypothetical protein
MTRILGRPFFSSTYLSVNYDEGTYTLWKARATEDTALVPIGSGCPIPATTPGPEKGTKNTESSSNRISAGAIAGIAIGCVVAVAALATVAFVLLRRRRIRSAAVIHEKDGSSFKGRDHALREPMSTEYYETDGKQRPAELSGRTNPVELSTEAANSTRQRRLLEGPNSPVELG